MKHTKAALLGLFLLLSLPFLNGKTTTFGALLQKSEELLNVDPQAVLETAQRHLTSLGQQAPAKERLDASLLVGRALVNLGRFPEALARFERIPDDPPSRTYIAQCQELIAHPPAEWDGVLSLTEK